MSEEDLRTMVREFRASVTAELEGVYRRIDAVETGLLNELKSLSRRFDRVDRAFARIEERLDRIDERLGGH